MSDWAYIRGEWQEITSPIVDASDESMEKVWGHHGYVKETTYGEAHAFHVELWTREPDQSWPFLVTFNTVDYYYPIWIPNLPSLIGVLRELLPIVRQELTIEGMINRARRLEQQR
jgi:hypothetical protein